MEDNGNQNLVKNLPKYCEKFLEIEGKDGRLTPFKLNSAQTFLHNELEAQIQKQGYVRAIVIKGRQQGCTTYIAARYYHKAIYNRGLKVFILSHDAKTTSAIFEKVKKYQYNIEKVFKNFAPKVLSLNNNQLVFDEVLGSKYTIGTAGNTTVGRGFTNQLLHLSEAAFYDNPSEIEKGLVQSVADMAGTEIIYETTANGQNFLFEKVKNVLNDPNSEYKVIFIPWFWQEEYKTYPVPNDFTPTREEQDLIEKYNLSYPQLLWRRKKIKQSSITEFKQEYPNNLEEAFEFSGESLVSAEKVREARENNFTVNDMMPRILGVDGSGAGNDRTLFVARQGRKITHWEKFTGKMTQPKLISLMMDRIHQWGIDATFADAAYGEGAIDTLKTLGYKGVFSVHFNMGALNSDLYLNKRAEIMCAVAEWFEEGADIPDNQEFADDILAIPFYKLTASHKRQIISKEEIKKVLNGKSPDIMDALALTFAFPVMKENQLTEYQRERHNKDMNLFKRKSKLHSLNVKRGVLL